jgi:hypothetical protein
MSTSRKLSPIQNEDDVKVINESSSTDSNEETGEIENPLFNPVTPNNSETSDFDSETEKMFAFFEEIEKRISQTKIQREAELEMVNLLLTKVQHDIQKNEYLLQVQRETKNDLEQRKNNLEGGNLKISMNPASLFSVLGKNSAKQQDFANIFKETKEVPNIQTYKRY